MIKFLSFLTVSLFCFSLSAKDAGSILDMVKKKSSSNYEDLELHMKITRKGETLERKLNIKKVTTAKVTKSLVKILAPKKIKGLGIYSEIKNGSEQQWIYLPSLKKSRRVLQGNRKSSFLDSDLNFEDFSADLYSGYNSTVKGSNKKEWLIESTPKSKDASYSKIVTTVDKKTYSIKKVNYFAGSSKPVKLMVATKFKKFGKIYRATKVLVKSPSKKSQTLLSIKKLSTKTFPSSKVSKARLER